MPSTDIKKDFSVPRGVPVIFAWGLHTGLSYQRHDFKQVDAETIKRDAIDSMVKYGANFFELYPSNKESQGRWVTQDEVDASPSYLFREHPDHDQENQWTLDDFREVNRYAHKKGFLVNWFIHCWYPASYAKRAKIFWKLARQIGLDVSDILADGFACQLDGFGTEGDYIVPQEINDLFWPYHPGISIREAAWGLNSTVANYIQTRGLQLTDGRDLICEAEIEGDYMNLAAPCWRHFDEFWKGESIKCDTGYLNVAMQAEARDTSCQDGPWSGFGGMSSPDILLEQINNYARAKLRNWTSCATTAMWFINEPLISARMRRYIGGIAGDPIRSATVMRLEKTGCDAQYPRTDYPSDTWIIQNNNYRIYCKNDSQCDLHMDTSLQANFTNFMWETTEKRFEKFFESTFGNNQVLCNCEYKPLEYAGAMAGLRGRFEYLSGKTMMVEFRDFWSSADNAWLKIDLQRLFLEGDQSRSAISKIKLDGYKITDSEKLKINQTIRFTHTTKPDIAVYTADGDDIDDIAWKADSSELSITTKQSQSQRFSVLICLDASELIDAPWMNELIEVDLANGKLKEVAIKAHDEIDAIRPIRIINPPEGTYWVCEDGYWMMRGGQPSWSNRNTDLVKLVLPAGSTSQIRPYGFLENAVRCGWGCQYTQLLKDVHVENGKVSLNVRVVDVVPNIWAPRLEFSQMIAKVTVNEKPWYYFEGEYLFLPNHHDDFDVSVEFGAVQTPTLMCTYGVVDSMRFDGNSLSIDTSLCEWTNSLHDGERYYMTVNNNGWTLESADNASVVRDVPDFEAIKPIPLAGSDAQSALVPRAYNHPPVKGFGKIKGQTLSYTPGDTVKLNFSKKD